MNRRVTTAVVAVIVLPALLGAVAGCGRTQQAPGASDTTSAPAGPSTGLTVIPAEDRRPAPELSGETLDGGTLDLAAMRGRPVLVNAWASWCEPCRAEAPLLVALAAEHPGISVVGIDVKDRADSARAFADEVGMTYPSIIDEDAKLLPRIPGVPPKALPSTVAIDRQGRVAAKVIGPVVPDMVPDLMGALRS